MEREREPEREPEREWEPGGAAVTARVTAKTVRSFFQRANMSHPKLPSRPVLSAKLRDALGDAGVEVGYEPMPAAAHLLMGEDAGGVREDFEAIVVDVISKAAAAAAAV